MKVCFFNSRIAWGGGEKWHLEMALGLKARGHNVTFVTSPGSVVIPELFLADVPVKTMNISNLSFLNPFKSGGLVSFFRQSRPEAVIINLPADLKIAAPAARKAGVPKIIYRRGSAIPVRNTWLNRRLYGMYLTHIIANSLETKKTILQNNPGLIPPEKIKVIYNGIDPDSFSGQRGDRPFDPPPGKIILGNAGRLVRQKGHDMLLDLANILAGKGTSFHLYVAGDGPLMGHLLKRRNDLGLEKHVSFLGHVENIHAFMSSLDIFLLTSRWEGFGYVLLEAMACARPVVCFNVSSNPELIMDGVNGFLVEYDDLSSFAERIAQLAGDPELRLSLGNSGHEILRTRFTHDRSIGELEKFMAE